MRVIIMSDQIDYHRLRNRNITRKKGKRLDELDLINEQEKREGDSEREKERERERRKEKRERERERERGQMV